MVVNQIKLKPKAQINRMAFTMIELVFAIVIIAVTMLSIPLVLQVNASNQEDALYQEGIMLSTTRISQILTFPWDPNSYLGTALTTGNSEVVDAGATAGLARVGANDFRVGQIQASLRRRFTPNAFPRAASAIGAGANSISSFDGDVMNVGAAGGQFSYKKSWNITTSVSYVSDVTDYTVDPIAYNFPVVPGGVSNIKMIQVSVIDPADPTNQGVLLTSYSSNIGEAEFYKRRY